MGFGGFIRRLKYRLYYTPISLRPDSVIIVTGLLFIIASIAAAASPRVVATSTDLLAAFVDASVTHIQLANSITVSGTKGPGQWPLLLGRDCLVDATPGSPYPRLDLVHATNDWVRLGPGVTLTFRGLVLTNVFSRSQLSLDFFAQSPASSSIVWEGVVDRRSICRPLQEILDVWNNAPRPADGSQQPQQQQQQPQQQQPQQQQQAIVEGPNCNGDQGCYSMPVLRSYNVLVDSPAGYRLRLNNTLTVCDQFISQACIQSLGSDICYLNAIEELMAKLNGGGPSGYSSPSSSPSSGAGGLSAGARAGIIAGCVVGGVVLLLLLALLLCALPVCRRRRRGGRLSAERQHHGDGNGSDGNGGGGAVAFSVLDPASSEAGGPATLGFPRSGDAKAPASATSAQQPPPLPPSPQLPQQQPHHPPHNLLNVVKLLPGGGTAALHGGGADGRPSADTATDSTDARPSSGPAPGPAALESAGASGVSYHVGIGSGHYTHTHTHTQSLGSAVMAILRSVLSRAGSRADLHAADLNGSPAAASAAAAGSAAQGSVAGSLRPPVSAKSGTLGSARGSSGGQVALRTGSGRPSMGEIQQELERMEEQWTREHARAGGGRGPHAPSSAPRGRGHRGGGAGGGAAAAASAAAGEGAGGRVQRHPPGELQAPPPPPPPPPPPLAKAPSRRQQQ